MDFTEGGYVSVNDPARGEEFEKSYSGICMLFDPAEDFAPGGKPASILKFASERLRGTFQMFLL